MKKTFLKKYSTKNRLSRRWRERRKVWENIDCVKEIEVYFLGYRTLKNGHVNYDYDEGVTFEPDESLRACLVIVNEKENPFYVLEKDLKDVTE